MKKVTSSFLDSMDSHFLHFFCDPLLPDHSKENKRSSFDQDAYVAFIEHFRLSSNSPFGNLDVLQGLTSQRKDWQFKVKSSEVTTVLQSLVPLEQPVVDERRGVAGGG